MSSTKIPRAKQVAKVSTKSPAPKTSVKTSGTAPKKIKGDSLKISYLDVLDYLIKYSSKEKCASINEMTEYFTALTDYAFSIKTSDFHQLTSKQRKTALSMLSANSKNYINDSVRLQLKRILDAFIDKEFILGISIKSTNKDTRSSKEKCFYVTMPFSETEIILLRDAISVFPYAEYKITKRIVDGLNHLTNMRNRIPYAPEVVYADKFKGSYYQNLKEILKAFHTDDGKLKKVSFVYCKYNHKKELEETVLKDGNTRRIVNPVKVMWANGYYYLVTFFIDDKNDLRYINYRIDRMKDAKCLTTDAELLGNHLVKREATVYNTRKDGIEGKRLDPKLVEDIKRIDDSGFSVGKYRYSHPVMHTGDMLSKVVIRIKRYLMNNAIDTFGFEFYVKEESNDDLIITIYDVSASGVKLWALEYSDNCEVLEPLSLRNSMAETTAKMVEKYIPDLKQPIATE